MSLYKKVGLKRGILFSSLLVFFTLICFFAHTTKIASAAPTDSGVYCTTSCPGSSGGIGDAGNTDGTLFICEAGNCNLSNGGSIIQLLPEATAGNTMVWQDTNLDGFNNSNVSVNVCDNNASQGKFYMAATHTTENIKINGSYTALANYANSFANDIQLITCAGPGTPESSLPIAVNAIVSLPTSDLSSVSGTLGPVNLILKNAAGNTVQTTQTNTDTGGSSGTSNFDTLNAAFPKPASPGVYTVCTSGIKPQVCKSVPQDDFKTTANVIRVTLSGIDGSTVFTPGDPTGKSGSPTCESSGWNLSWVACPLINGVAIVETDIINNVVNPMLKTQPIQLHDNSKECHTGNTTCNAYNQIYSLWSTFRNYGDIILVITILVVVIAEAAGGGLLDAYTVQKILPRILIAAILINLSIYIVAGLEDIVNILGKGIFDLVSLPFREFNAYGIKLGSVAGDFTGFAAIALAASSIWTAFHISAVLPFFLLFVGLPVLFTFLGIMATVVLRQAILVFLVLSSPIAFALYCLPNTEQYFKKWWNLLLKTLLVYPIVELVFAMAGITGVIVSTLPLGAPWNQLMGVVAKLAPLALIPFAFKMSGGVVGQIYEGANSFGKKASEGIKGNPNNPFSLRNGAKKGLLKAITRSQQNIVDKAEKKVVDKDTGAIISRSSRRMRALGAVVNATGGSIQGRMSRFNKEDAQMAEDMSGTGRDAYRYGGAGYIIEEGEQGYGGVTDVADHRRYFNSKNEEIQRGEYKKSKSLLGRGLNGVGAQLEYTTRKAQNEEDLAKMRFAFAQNAKAGNWTEKEMKDVWAQAVFPHKDKWLSEWFSTPTPTDGKSGRGGVTFKDVSNDMGQLDKEVSEQHSTKEAFRAASLRPEDWVAQNDEMVRIQNKIDADAASGRTDTTQEELNRYAKISENLDVMAQDRQMTSLDDKGEVMVTGGSSAKARGALQAMYKNRKYTATAAKDGSGGYSLQDRILVNNREVDREYNRDMGLYQNALRTGTLPRGAVAPDKDTYVGRHTVLTPGSATPRLAPIGADRSNIVSNIHIP